MLGILPIVGAISGLIAKFLTVATLKWLAIKALVWTLLVTVFPMVIYSIITKIMDEVLTWATSQISSQGLDAVVYNVTGFGGWVAQQMRLPEAISIILSAVAIKAVLVLTRVYR